MIETVDSHVRTRHLDLGRGLHAKKMIYLDIKFWIHLREVLLGRCREEEERSLLHLLQTLVGKGKIVCPISIDLVSELLKQEDPVTRSATVELMENLSGGIAIISYEKRLGAEIAFLIRSMNSNAELHPVRDLVWTKASFLYGAIFPSNPRWDKAMEMTIQKGFFDHLWSLPASKIIESLAGGPMADSAHRNALAARLSDESLQHAGTLKSFQHTYRMEVQGIAPLFSNTALETIGEMFRETTGEEPNPSLKDRRTFDQMWTNLLTSGSKKDAMKDILRTLHISAALHADVRWNKRQRLKANDLWDFSHATAALAYCDLFLKAKKSAADSRNCLKGGDWFMATTIAATRQVVEDYQRLFVNRRAYTMQSMRPHPETGRHYYFRPSKRGTDVPLMLTDESVRRHLEGEITVGLYAINPSTQRCKWVAIDADYKNSMEDLLKLQYHLIQDRVEPALEMSKRGGHLWIFLATPLLAMECRIYIHDLALRLGVPVKGAGLADGIEVFPKHDAIGVGEFGNAIRGPLGIHRGAHRRFWFYGADYTLAAQIAYLNGLRKVTEEELRTYIAGKERPAAVVSLAPGRNTLPQRKYRSGESDFRILAHVGAVRKVGRNYITRCPSCADAGHDRSGDNLATLIEDPRFYKCWAGCTKEMIRAALGCPIRVLSSA